MLALRYTLAALTRAVAMVVGIPGNSLIIIVYCKKQRKSGTDVFILGLAIADLVVCLTFPLKIYSYVTTQFTSEVLCKMMYLMLHWNTFVGVFLTWIVTVDRYIAVCKPLRKRLSSRQATMLVSIFFVFAMFFAAPVIPWTGVQTLGPFASRCTYSLSTLTYTWIINTINDALYFVSLVTIVFMYSRIWLTVHRRSKAKVGCTPAGINTISGQVSSMQMPEKSFEASESEARQSGSTNDANLNDCKPENTGKITHSAPIDDPNTGDSSVANGSVEGSSPRETSLPGKPEQQIKPGKTPMQARISNKTTKMIFIITLIFFVSWIPSKIWVLYPNTKYSLIDTNPVAYNIFYLSTLMVNINQVINPFVYSFCNVNFRKECITLMRHARQCRLS